MAREISAGGNKKTPLCTSGATICPLTKKIAGMPLAFRQLCPYVCITTPDKRWGVGNKSQNKLFSSDFYGH
jgi:hypothetical protein